jgi:general secretion pathway protein H
VRPNAAASSRSGGFTLIEMIVVIAVMGMIAGLVLVRQPWHSAGLTLEAAERAFIDALRLARSRAIVQNRVVPVVTGAAGFSIDGAPPVLLPEHEAMGESRFVFMPDGGSSGATVILASKTKRVAVTVSWLNGRIRAREFDAP